ncbi:MAG TPA: MBL fold metallo-hydrolase [Gammaproteobacteria bacterium]|nr:MBL fold metallo-hydrolase [Gammaproteobacteria bacterium]
MDLPYLQEPRPVAPDTHILPAQLPVPGLGTLGVNAFLLHAREPVLVDTGLAALREDFLAALHRLIDPADLRWIWLTHTDWDHVGNLSAVLDEAPEARLVTTFLGMAKLGLAGLPTDRVYLVNPGQRLPVGDRDLYAVVPPIYDAPETTGFQDTETRVLFSSDCFGALLGEPAEVAGAIPKEALEEGMIAWAGVDAPWLGLAEENRYGKALEAARGLAPSTVLSSHLPPAEGMIGTLLGALAKARSAPAFRGPDQVELERMMAGSAGAA